MRSIIAVVLLAVLVGFTVSSPALSGDAATMEGTVESISPETLAIMSEIGTAQQMVEIQINAETVFNEGGLQDLIQRGDQVRVQYREEGQDKIAISVDRIVETTDES